MTLSTLKPTRRVDVGDTELAVAVVGDEAAPLAVAMHGFPDCARTFRLLAPALVTAGWRVAVPTMRGYAPSGPAASGDYGPMRLGRDLLAVAEALSPGRPVAAIGHDWGAVAVMAAAALAPHRIATLVTMAVPHLRTAWSRWLHPRQLHRSRYMLAFQLPGAERRLVADDGAAIERLWRRWSPGYRCPADEMRAVKDATLPHAGATIAYYRALRRPTRERQQLFRRTAVPCLHLHGENDGCIGVAATDGLEDAFTGPFALVRVAGAGHFLHLEAPGRVHEPILAALARSRP